MRQRREDLDPPPRREELAAYFDGELSGPRRQQLEEWLADHADALTDLEEWRHVAEVTRATQAADPGPAVWSQVLARIAATTQPVRPRYQPWLRVALASAGAVAAALLLAILLSKSPSDGEPESLVMASAADVEIISIDADDVPALVVGHAPLREPLVLADSADINLEHIEPDHDGSMPSIRWWVGVEAPMIVATLTPDPEPEQ